MSNNISPKVYLSVPIPTVNHLDGSMMKLSQRIDLNEITVTVVDAIGSIEVSLAEVVDRVVVDINRESSRRIKK